jgi:hypothetical protein
VERARSRAPWKETQRRRCAFAAVKRRRHLYTCFVCIKYFNSFCVFSVLFVPLLPPRPFAQFCFAFSDVS